MPLPILLTEYDLTAWCCVDPSARANNSATLAGERILLLIDQASFGPDLPSELVVRLEVGYDFPAADIAILQYIVVQAS
jgi:hypothetical protein